MDIHNYDDKFMAAMRRLDKSAMAEQNKDEIRRFVAWKATEKKVGVARQVKYITLLRALMEKYLKEDALFSALTREDVTGIISEIERSDLSEWSKHDYELFLKAFLTWLGRGEIVDWITITKPRNLPDDILMEDEITAMIDAASNLRDKALIATLYEGGFRIGELGGLRVRDITFDKYGAIALVSGKTGMRRVRLIWSMPYIAQWLEVHPLREDRDAPLWIKVNGKPEMLEYPAIRIQLQKIAKRAGIQKRVNPHNFRHSRSTHLASKLTESQMEEYLGWVHGSKMPSIYVHMSGRDLDADLLKMYGLSPSAEDEKEELKTLQCPHCRTLNTVGARICINCRKPLAVEEMMEREEKGMEMFRDFMELVTTRPEMMERFKKYFNRD